MTTPTNEIPPALLEAATAAILKAQGYTLVWRSEHQRDAEVFAQAALEAAGVGALIARIAELEAECNELTAALLIERDGRVKAQPGANGGEQ